VTVARAPDVLRVHAVRSELGALQFSVDLEGRTQELFVRTSLPVVPGADIAVAMTLVPAMIRAGRLEVEAPVDETLLRRLPEIQAVWRAFQLGGDWTPAAEIKRDVEVVCEAAAVPVPVPVPVADRGVAAFFSAGVDSFATFARNPEITHFIYVAGMDAPAEPQFDTHHAMVRETVSGIANRLGRSLITIETNARALYGEMGLVGPTFGGSLLAAAARLTAPAMRRVYIAASQCHGALLENSTHPLLDPLWGRDVVEIVHDGAELARTEKLEAIAEDEVARASLRVCWAGSGSQYNCCVCEKCLRTMVALEAVGVLEGFPSFAKPLDLGLVARTKPGVRHELAYWLENLELAIDRGAAPELIQAIRSAIALADPGSVARPPRSGLANPAPPRNRALFMSPSFPAALADHSEAVFLLGARSVERGPGAEARQRIAALLSRRATDAAVVPVLRLCDPDSGEIDPVVAGDATVLSFAPAPREAERALDLGMIPAGLPPGIQRAVIYLYGGAYLNRLRAEPMLTMLEGIQTLVERAGTRPPPIVSSGLELDPVWARMAGVRYDRLLAHVDRLRVSDELSLHAARLLPQADAPPSVLSGDDLYALYTDAGCGARVPAELDSPDADGRVRATERALAAAMGTAAAELTVCRAPDQARGVLMEGRPALILRDRSDMQAAEALRSDFNLPRALVPDPGRSADSIAVALAAELEDAGARARLAESLAGGRARAVERRRAMDREITESLRAALDPAAAEPSATDGAAAADYMRLVELHRTAVERLDAEMARARARQAELESLRASASWRLTAPLRRVKRSLTRSR
jgi:hypothetical protein